MSVSFGVPLVMDRWSEACYRFPMLVSDNTLEASLDRLSDVDDQELLEVHSELAVFREQAIKQSERELARLIARIL